MEPEKIETPPTREHRLTRSTRAPPKSKSPSRAGERKPRVSRSREKKKAKSRRPTKPPESPAKPVVGGSPLSPAVQTAGVTSDESTAKPPILEKPPGELESTLATLTAQNENADQRENVPSPPSARMSPPTSTPGPCLAKPTVKITDEEATKDTGTTKTGKMSPAKPVVGASPLAPAVQTAGVTSDESTTKPPIIEKPPGELEGTLATLTAQNQDAKPREHSVTPPSANLSTPASTPGPSLPKPTVKIMDEERTKDTGTTKTREWKRSAFKDSDAVSLASRATPQRSKSLKEVPIDHESLAMLLTTRPSNLQSSPMRQRVADVPKGVLTFAGIGCAALVLLIVALVFVVVSGHKYLVCENAVCTLYSDFLANTLAPSGNPCKDFHHYVCAGWEANNSMSLQKYVLEGFLRKVSRMASNPVIYTGRQSAVQKAAIFYQSCFGVLKHNFNHLQLVKDSLIDFGVFWPEISNKSNVLKIFFSIAAAWNWGSPVHFYVNRPGIIEAKPAVLFGVTMKKTEAMQASEKPYYQRFFEKLVEDFSRPRAKALSYAEHKLIESRVLQPLRNVYWMKNSTTMTNASVDEVVALSKHTIKRTDWDNQLKAYFSSTPGGFDAYFVTIYNTDFFAAFFQLLLSDEESYIAYYVGWCVVQVASQLASKELIEYSYTSEHEASTGHTNLCSAMTLSYIGLPFYAGQVNHKIRHLTVSRARKLFNNVFAAFQTALKRSDFKVHLAQFSAVSIGNETSILDLFRRCNESMLDGKYVHFPDMNTDVWHNINAATIARRVTEVNETLLDYIELDVQPAYRLRRHHFELLPLAFEEPFYDDDTIAAANYGALGSEMASGFAGLIFKQISMSGNDTLTKLEKKTSCFATSKAPSTAGSHFLWDKKNSELLGRATALRMTYHAYFAGDRDWGDYRLPRYPELTDKQLLFIFSCLLQCGKPDAQFRCNGPLETLRSFGSAFGCAPGEPMHSGRDCAVLI